MSIQPWEHFFKSSIRASGRILFAQGKVSIVQPSDTEVVAYIRTSPPLKVVFKTNSISSPRLIVDCNCPAGKKDQLCKHIWASLLATEQIMPDFFISKTEIEKKESLPIKKSATATAKSQGWAERQAALKELQKSYRRKQYKKDKQRIKELKQNKKSSPKDLTFPIEVEKALIYFSQNGFELRENLKKEFVSIAMKKLARVFHPDLGGSHHESLELNKSHDILMAFIRHNSLKP